MGANAGENGSAGSSLEWKITKAFFIYELGVEKRRKSMYCSTK